MKKRERLRRVALRGSIALILLLLAGWFVENLRGAKAWEEAQARAEAAGMSLNRADYAGTEIRDEDNLLLKPEFKVEFEMEESARLREWRKMLRLGNPNIDGSRPHQGVATGYRKWFREEITESEAQKSVVEAAKEVEERLATLSSVILETPVHSVFAKGEATQDFMESTEWTLPILGFTKCFEDSGVLAIRQGNGELALERIRALCRLSQMTQGSSLISLLISNAMKSKAMGLVWEGLLFRVWDDAQLTVLQSEFSDLKYEERLERAIAFEAAWGIEYLSFIELGGEGITGVKITEPDSFLNSYYYGGLQGWKDRRRAIIIDGALGLLEVFRTRDFEGLKKERNPNPSPYSPMYAVAGAHLLISGTLNGGAWRPATESRICRIALAAERAFLKDGTYPKNISGLELEFSTTDLTDPEERELAYDLGPNERPQIWSRFQEEFGDDGEERLRWQFWSEGMRVGKVAPN